MHYAPTPSTLVGEPPALHPFLGSSRLAEPLARHGVLVAFHGHAHQGSPEGRTESGVPVLNVARPVLEGSSWPGGFRIVEVRPEGHARPRPDAAPATGAVDERTAGYRRALAAQSHAGGDFVVGGSHALEVLTGIDRHTRDLDLFVLPADRYLALDALGDAGFDVELRDPHWLGRAERDGNRIDLIHGIPNGVARVEPDWFRHAIDGVVLGVPTQVLAAEEMIWSKAFVMERHRFDGADVAHLIRACAARLHWERLERRFGDHWRLLLSHLVLFGFVYPGDRNRIPRELLDRLIERLGAEGPASRAAAGLCQGGLLSPTQYQPDFECFGYGDVRLPPHGALTAAAVALQRERSRGAG
jgi:hypothetical protein